MVLVTKSQAYEISANEMSGVGANVSDVCFQVFGDHLCRGPDYPAKSRYLAGEGQLFQSRAIQLLPDNNYFMHRAAPDYFRLNRG